jgi:hypothetical protein
MRTLIAATLIAGLAAAPVAADDVARAKEFGQKAVEAAPNEGTKQAIRRAIQKFDAPPSPGEKK